ncbi:hypothetical protein FF1_021916 [Malus domestica]
MRASISSCQLRSNWKNGWNMCHSWLCSRKDFGDAYQVEISSMTIEAEQYKLLTNLVRSKAGISKNDSLHVLHPRTGFQKRFLQINGERSREQEDKNDKWHRVERSSGKFIRRFRLPENVKID